MILLTINIASIIMFTSISVLFSKFYPREINPVIGYRTKLSMSSEKAWLLANEYSSRLLVRYSIVTLLIQITLFFAFDAMVALWGMMSSWLVLLFLTIFQTERKLKKSGF